MLHVESLAPTLRSTPDAAVLKALPAAKDGLQPPVRLIEMTFRTVELDGRNLWREPENVAVGQLAESVRLADLRTKSELYIRNIAPWISVGQEESYQVPILQSKIQGYLAQACKKLRRPEPACRLDLSRGEYGIRCYLGRIKPTDHVYTQDLVSDSR